MATSMSPGMEMDFKSSLPDKNEIAVKPSRSMWHRLTDNIEAFCESDVFTTTMMILTIYALYQSDIRLAATDASADPALLAVATVIFFTFLIEIILQCTYKVDYFYLPQWEAYPGEEWYMTWLRRVQVGSFYFWTDCISTATLTFDLTWMIGSLSEQINGTGGYVGGDSTSIAQSFARAGRLVRMVRMVRLLRMVKLYKHFLSTFDFLAIEQDEIEQEHKDVVPEEESNSHVGAAMSDLTNRRVIILILIMLIVIPLLTNSDSNTSLVIGSKMVHDMGLLASVDPGVYQEGFDLMLEFFIKELPVLHAEVGGVVHYDKQSIIDTLRPVERQEVIVTSSEFESFFVFDQKHVSQQTALYSIYTTTFVIGLLMIGIYFFSADVNHLVINPIEQLVDLVKRISANPLMVEYKTLGAEQGFIEGMETTILLNTITKIGGLMRVGFGEAGANIIAKNLSESAAGTLNLMGAGTRINSIFGFCDVRQFTDTTECLQEEVMLFVNRIAHILHSIVVQCSGAANKNIGDAFLLTWRVSEYAEEERKSYIVQIEERTQSLADQALLTFCRALIELSRYRDFICNFSPEATERLMRRFPDYQVRIGCGLHYGWAIEGAIGSNRKIDASYLSPHVSTTEFLESSTKSYGVCLLMSSAFHHLLSKVVKKLCRQVDHIQRSPHEEPMGLYTYDTDMDVNWNAVRKANHRERLQAALKPKTYRADSTAAPYIPIDPHAKPIRSRRASISEIARRTSTFAMRALAFQQENEEMLETTTGPEDVDKTKPPNVVVFPYTRNVWHEDAEIIMLRNRMSDELRELWNDGFAAFLEGKWEEAHSIISEVQRRCSGKDGPAAFLLPLINQAAPSNWNGYRILSDDH